MIRLVNETIRWIDSIKAENQYINKKFRDKADFIDTEARINIKGLIQTPSAIKCFYRVNAYGTLDSARNKYNSIYDCLRYSTIEIQEYVIQCKKTEEMRPKFIVEMYKELKSIQKETITNKILRTIINDIRKYL